MTSTEQSTQTLFVEVDSSCDQVLAPETHDGVPSYSLHYSFMWIEASFFLMFQAFLTVQNQASSFVGDTATLALSLLYVGYIISNLLAPVQMSFFGGNPNKAMFFGSMSYTLFVFAFYLALEGHEWVLYPTAIIEGLCGGLIWVGNGVYQTGLSVYSGQTFTEKNKLDQGSVPRSAEYLQEGYLLVKNAAISFMNSVQWVIMNSTIAVGSIVAYVLVKDGKVKPGTDTMEADIDKTKLLFLILTGVSIVANISLYITWKNAIPCVITLQKQSPVTQVLNTVKNAMNLTMVKAVILICPYFIAANMVVNFFYSGFMGTPVKLTLGAINVPLICIVVAVSDITGAMIASPLCKTLRNTRRTGILGTSLLLVSLLLAIIFPYDSWTKSTISGREGKYQWAACIGLGMLTGLADGLAATAVNTYVSHLIGENKNVSAPLFSIMQVMKGFGSTLAFFLASVCSFETAQLVVFVIGILSLTGQVIALITNPGLESYILPFPPTAEESLPSEQDKMPLEAEEMKEIREYSTTYSKV